MVNINEEQITRLKTQAEQFGGVDSQQFKDKVNTQYGAGSYDKLVKNVAGSIQSGAIQGNMENANKIAPTPTPTEPVGTKIEPQTPVLPEATPTPTETVKTESITTPKPTNLGTIQGKNVMSEAPEFKGADGQTYKTVRFDDGSLGTVKVGEGGVNELVGNTYKDEQRADMKQIVEQGLNNADNIFNNLLRGQVLPEVVKTSNNYVKAQNRFNQYNQFKNLNQSQYQQLLAQGKLIPGTQAYNDLMNDPVAKSNIIKAQNLNAINQNQKAEEKIASTENNQSDVILSNNPTVAQALEDGTLSVEEYQSLTNTPDITEKSKNVSKLKEEYIRLKSDYDAVEDEVNAELSGKGLSTSYINAKISERRKSLYKGLSLAEQLYTSAMGELTTMKKDATDLLETNLGLYKDRLKRNQELEDRQYQEDLTTRTMQRQYDYTYGDINSTDPRIQNRAIQEAVKSMYEKYPIPGLESQSIKVQKIKDRIAQGMSGTQAIQEVENEIRNSNRYKQYLVSEQAKMNPKETQDWAKLSDGTLYNQRTGETRSVGDIGTSGNVGGYYSGFRITQDVGAKSPNSKDTGYNGGTPGIDFAMPENTPVLSTVEGEVTFVGNNGDYGNQVVVKDSNGNLHMYSHLNYSDVQVGDTVSAGQNIALSGGKKGAPGAGFSTGAHLDYRVKSTDGKWQDPKQYLMDNLQDEVKGLTIGLGGTEKERAEIQDAIVKKAREEGISIQEAKKKLRYKTGDDIEFAKTRKEDYQNIKKSIGESTSNAKTALTLLNQPQTAINDVASVVGFLKTIDPASVARESEVESVENARGVIDNLSNTFAKLKEGTKLTDTQRKQLKDAIQTIVNASDVKYNEYVRDLVAEFEERGLDASTYIPKTEVERVLKGLEAKTITTTQNTGTSVQNTYTSNSGKTYNLNDYR